MSHPSTCNRNYGTSVKPRFITVWNKINLNIDIHIPLVWKTWKVFIGFSNTQYLNDMNKICSQWAYWFQNQTQLKLIQFLSQAKIFFLDSLCTAKFSQYLSMRSVNGSLVLNLPLKHLMNKILHSVIAFFICVFKYSNPTSDSIMDVGFYYKYLCIRYVSIVTKILHRQ